MVFFRIFDQNWPILTKMTIWDPPVNQPNIDFQKKWFWYSFFTPKKYSKKKVLILICEKKPICSPPYLMGDGTIGGGLLPHFWLGDFFSYFHWISIKKLLDMLWKCVFRTFGEKNVEKTLRVWCHVTSKSAVVDPPIVP